MKRILMATALAVVLVPTASFAGTTNNTSIKPGGGWVDLSTPAGNATFNTYWFRVQPGKSYCAETQAGFFSDQSGDSVIEVYLQDSITLIASNDDDAVEPRGYRLSRVCWIATEAAGSVEYVKVRNFSSGSPSQNYRLRVTETTLFAPYFITGGGYDAFLLMKNTTNQTINGQIKLFDGATGAQLGATQTFAVLPNANKNYSLSAAPFSLGGGATGNFQISIDGPSGSIMGSITSISFTAGVSFDTAIAPREDWSN